ncbi:MAG: (d)CMP kinase [Actinomycetes bacterium]
MESARVGQRVVVAVDGPSGSGKSSTARGVATRLGLRYLDTGALYRAVTWSMLQRSVDVHDAAAVAEAVSSIDVTLSTDPADPRVGVDGRDVSDEIRERDVTNAVSAVSAVPEVRRALVPVQRRIIDAGGVVVEGRDIGSVVAPDATVKVFLTADSRERAQRRSAELEHDQEVTVELTLDELRRRDHLDSSREVSPLVRADDALVLDSTDLTLDQVIDAIVALVEPHLSSVPGRG